MKSTKFHSLVLIRKYIFKTMNMMVSSCLSRVHFELIRKNSHLNDYFLKILFCQVYCFNFFPSQNSFFIKHIVRPLAWHIKCKKIKALKKKMVDLMHVKRQEKGKRPNFY